MKSVVEKYKSLECALNILKSYEDNSGIGAHGDLECVLFHSLRMFVEDLRTHLRTTKRCPQRLELIGAFRMLAEISFDKLERDIMGVN